MSKKQHRYEVPVLVTGYVNVFVYAESEEEAKKKAIQEVDEMDFGPLGNIDYEVLPCTRL